MSRWKAVAIHSSISLCIGCIVAVLLFGVWYPPPYFHAAGADELMLLLVGADVVLGPLLTLIVFKSGKRGMRFDLCVIAILQAGALVYGMSVVLASRPVFLVAALDRFELVSAADITPENLAEGGRPEFRSLSWGGPRLVALELPQSKIERSDLVFSTMSGPDLPARPKYYVEYDKAAATMAAQAKSLDAIPQLDTKQRERLDRAVKASCKPASTLGWLPLVARKHDLMMLIDRKSGAPLAAVAANPWPG